jgi:hypothetical protein
MRHLTTGIEGAVTAWPERSSRNFSVSDHGSTLSVVTCGRDFVPEPLPRHRMTIGRDRAARDRLIMRCPVLIAYTIYQLLRLRPHVL